MTCLHSRAEPVTLLTGETVAALCADCLTKLPAAWIDCLKTGHDELAEATELGSSRPQYICRNCNGIYQEAE